MPKVEQIADNFHVPLRSLFLVDGGVCGVSPDVESEVLLRPYWCLSDSRGLEPYHDPGLGFKV